ncbi:post-transcriptional regulator [Caldibacillus lycopersici]|uniref:Post-transcriptional regulator n=1 Tax=Perspicuibacillus lycopersici TaxID=1325689 RepID=A0AAE3ITB3_9BACI|nr:post-transcriptional regulator [Perspicuibacillus lycopersici]MCU9613987.1 post-transcriptional regulator [Perspicuibacillus lycopersici]
MDTHPYDHFLEEVKEVLRSKLEEFKLFDYDQVTEEELWNFLMKKKWRKPKEDIHIYEIVKDIFSLKVSDFIAFAQVEHLRMDDIFSEAGALELKELLKK